MNKQLRSILDELYALDADLRSQEQELIPLLQKLLEHKPDASPDEAFVEHLRVMLRDKAARPASSRSLFSFFSMPAFRYAITGVVLGAVITGPVVYGITQSGGLPLISSPEDGSALFSYSVEDAGEQAFGDLPLGAGSSAYGRGGGGMMGSMPVSDSAVPAPSNGTTTSDEADQRMMIMPPGDITAYRLTFDGDMPELPAGDVDVLKRRQGISGADTNAIMRSFNTGLIDIGSFAGARADMITFSQDAPYGYMVNVSFREGSVSVSANWERWPNPAADCTDEACFQRMQMQIGNVPSDDVILGIADSFVRAHDIDLAQYGEPEVDDFWRTQYEQAPDRSSFYVPDQIRVIYPLLVEGEPVFDEGGAKTGLSVGVNIREQKVSDVWGIQNQQYLRSAYPAVTDQAKILAYLENHDRIQPEWLPAGTNVRTVDITLGTPTTGYVRMYNYSNGTNEELLVPALLFPVTNVPDGQTYYRNTIAVPLAADMLDRTAGQGGPRPMPVEPLMMDGGDTPIMEDNAQ